MCRLYSGFFLLVLLAFTSALWEPDINNRDCTFFSPIEMENLESYKSKLFNELESLFKISSYLKEREFESNICSTKKKVENAEEIAKKRGDYEIRFSVKQEKKKYKLSFRESGDTSGIIYGSAYFYVGDCLTRSVYYNNYGDPDPSKKRMRTMVITNENVTRYNSGNLRGGLTIVSNPGIAPCSQCGYSGDSRKFTSNIKSESLDTENHFGEFEVENPKSD